MKIIFHQGGRQVDLSAARAQFPAARFVEAETPADVKADITDAEILVIATSGYDEAMARVILDGAKALKWVHFTTSGIDGAIKVGGFPAGVTVTNSAGLRANNLTDHAFGMLRFLARNFRGTERARAKKVWDRPALSPTIYGLEGLTMTIVGLGALGQAAARKAKAFDMRVLGVSRAYKPDGTVDEVFPRERAKEAIARADALLIAVPSEPQTRGFIDGAMLKAMKKTAWIVNVSRGDVIDEPALIAALKAGTIAGAGLDVTVEEPLPRDNELWTLDNVFIAPHVGGSGTHTHAPMVKIFTDNLERYLKRQPLKLVVDWQAMMNEA